MPNRTYAWPEGHWDWYQHLAFKHGVRVGDMALVGGQIPFLPLEALMVSVETVAMARAECQRERRG
jgi:hypothetical protein